MVPVIYLTIPYSLTLETVSQAVDTPLRKAAIRHDQRV